MKHSVLFNKYSINGENNKKKYGSVDFTKCNLTLQLNYIFITITRLVMEINTVSRVNILYTVYGLSFK